MSTDQARGTGSIRIGAGPTEGKGIGAEAYGLPYAGGTEQHPCHCRGYFTRSTMEAFY